MPLGAKRGAGRDAHASGGGPHAMACDAPLSTSPGATPWGRPKARRTGPAVPASVRHAAAGSPPLPPCTRGGGGGGCGAAAAAAAECDAAAEPPCPRPQLQPGALGCPAARPPWHGAGAAAGAADGAADASPPADQARGGGAAAPPAAGPPPPLPPRKAVRFAPGPLRVAGRPDGAVGRDGHPLGEGRVAAPVRPAAPPPPGSTDPVTRANIAALEELLGSENAPSLGRLKRRVGLLPPGRPPRVHLTTAPPAAQRQAA
jgi:hypothetical protein